MDDKVLRQCFDYIQTYLDSLATRKVKESASKEELVEMLGAELPKASEDPSATLERLTRAGELGTVACSGPRYFGFVIGGSLPAAQAADWLTTTWDQNAGLYVISPLNSVAEELASSWLLDVFGLPKTAGLGFVTGGQMANFTALASARHEMLRRIGWDVETEGLQNAPKLNIVVGDEAHVTIFNVLRFLGLGSGTAKKVKADSQGRMLVDDLGKVLLTCQGPTIVCAQAGNVNSGAFDPIDEIADLTREKEAWLHVDGAFGLWAAASPSFQHLVKGIAKADSWAVDGHKWLNVPYDTGFAIVAHKNALLGAFGSSASYLLESTARRDPHNYGPEFSKRARGIAVYAAMRSLGREGLATLVEGCCDHAKKFEELLTKDKRVEILNDVVLNQVVVRFLESDELTDAVIKRVQEEGICWLAGTKWQGKVAMRISVCNWSTTTKDVEVSVTSILSALDAVAKKSLGQA